VSAGGAPGSPFRVWIFFEIVQPIPGHEEGAAIRNGGIGGRPQAPACGRGTRARRPGGLGLRDPTARLAADCQEGGLLHWEEGIALYSSASATKALLTGLDVAYGVPESRGFVELNALALLLTLGAIVAFLVSLVLVAVVPAAVQHLPIPGALKLTVRWVRWPLLAGEFLVALALLYRYGPDRAKPKWRWLSWGAALAGVFWLAGSALFSLYVSTFGKYDKTYGSLAAVIVFLLWLFLSAFAVLAGAELNARIEEEAAERRPE
jgi:YihY family inner membrane protein